MARPQAIARSEAVGGRRPLDSFCTPTTATSAGLDYGAVLNTPLVLSAYCLLWDRPALVLLSGAPSSSQTHCLQMLDVL